MRNSGPVQIQAMSIEAPCTPREKWFGKTEKDDIAPASTHPNVLIERGQTVQTNRAISELRRFSFTW